MKYFLYTLTAFLISISAFGQQPKDEMNDLINNCLADINADSIADYIISLEGFTTRFALADNHRDVAVWIKNKFESFGCVAKLDSFQTTVQWPFYSGNYHTTWQYNVEATITGSESPEEYYVMGAHHDAILYPDGDPMISSPGADDNASGVAAALEVARVLKLHNYQPTSSLRFVTFAMEELGLYGSYDYAEKMAEDGVNIVAMLNNDMISNSPANNWTVNIADYPNAIDLVNDALLLIDEYTTLNYTIDNSYMQYSDSWAFYQSDYPAVFFAESVFSPYYHTIDDVSGNINPDYCAEVTKVCAAYLISKNGTVTGGVGIQPIETNYLNLKCFPNPVNESAKLRFELQTPQNVTISLYNTSGVLLQTVINEERAAGNQVAYIATNNLPTGIYLAVIKAGNTSETIKINVIH